MEQLQLGTYKLKNARQVREICQSEKWEAYSVMMTWDFFMGDKRTLEFVSDV